MIDAKDNNGNSIVVAINLEGKVNGVEVNDITSIYGRENINDFIRWEEKGLLEGGNYEKFEAWLASMPVNNIEGMQTVLQI